MNSWKVSALAFVVVCLAFTQARNVKLQTADGEVIGTDIKVANVSGYISGLLESVNLEQNEEEPTIPLPNVNAKVLRLILQWAEYHKDDAVVVIDDKTKIEIPAWDKDFLSKLEQHELFDVILAANILDVNGLLQVSCKTVADMIKGKSPEEIRKLFNIKNDFTEEEQAQIAANNNL